MSTTSDNFILNLPSTEEEMLAIAISSFKYNNKSKERMLMDAEALHQCAEIIEREVERLT